MDVNTEQYKAAITLSNLTLYDLTAPVWHVAQRNHLEGQITPDVENVREVVGEWAKVLECEVTEVSYDQYTLVQLITRYGDFNTEVEIWGHADRA